jgi:flagellar hook-length control protein FliK
LAGVKAALVAVEAKQRPEAPPKGKQQTTETRAARKPGKPGKSFAAAFLGKLGDQMKGRRTAGALAQAKAGEAARTAGKSLSLRQRSAPARRPGTGVAELLGAGETGAVPGDTRTAKAKTPEAAAGKRPAAKVGPRTQPRLVILDLRRPGADKKLRNQAAPAEPAGKSTAPAQSGVTELRLVNRTAAANGSEFSLPGSANQTYPQERGTAPGIPLPESFQRVWQDKMVPEVVKHTGIIVRDGGEGEIRLILKPETLGNVRIRISINNNSVEGRIVVENNSVKELFDASLDNLKASLRQEGFQSASLEVSVGNQKTRQEAENRQQAGSSLAVLREEAADEFDRFIPRVGSWADGDYVVNLVI